MGFRNPITSASAVDTRPGVTGAGVRMYQTTDAAGHPMGVVEFTDGFGDPPAQVTSTAYYNTDGSSSVGGSTRVKGGGWQGVTPAELDLNVEGLPAGGYAAVARLIADIGYLPADTRIGGKVLERNYYAHARQGNPQSLGSGGWVPITHTLTDYDTAGFWAAAVPSRLTAPVYGVYEAVGMIHFAANTAGRRGVRYNYAPDSATSAMVVADAVGAFVAASSNVTGVPCTPHLFTLKAGGWVELQGFQDSGVALSTFVGVDSASYFELRLRQPL